MIEDPRGAISLAHQGKGGSQAEVGEVQQIPEVRTRPCGLVVYQYQNLMEKVCDIANLNLAYKRVKANKGVHGVDGMTIHQMGSHIRLHKEQLIKSLLDGSYKPQPVRRMTIPKIGGGVRHLGIPTVIDRLIQQAILQVLEPIFDPGFSESSYGFRPKRSAHGALQKAQEYVRDGRGWVVDMDLESFFDRVNHDILMSRLARVIGDKRLLRIIRAFLNAGIMQDGLIRPTDEGTPQGGPLSPLLSNILLDELDKELEKRGHKFCRYADDQNIYVRSKKAGDRTFASVRSFLEEKLKLKVNEEKSAVARVAVRTFLGYRIKKDGGLKIAPESLKRAKDRVRRLTRRKQATSFKAVIDGLNVFLRGWLAYYRLAVASSVRNQLDEWIRRKLRCYKLSQQKRASSVRSLLMSLGVSTLESHKLSLSGKGWWRLSRSYAVHKALNIAWFNSQGLISLEDQWYRWLLKASHGTAVCNQARTVV